MLNRQLVRFNNQLIRLFCLAAALYGFSAVKAQLPPRQWAQHYGGPGVDIPFVIKITSDGGTVRVM